MRFWASVSGFRALPETGGNDASGDNSASIDIFESAMRSLFDASKTVIDAVLNGEFEANR